MFGGREITLILSGLLLSLCCCGILGEGNLTDSQWFVVVVFVLLLLYVCGEGELTDSQWFVVVFVLLWYFGGREISLILSGLLLLLLLSLCCCGILGGGKSH